MPSASTTRRPPRVALRARAKAQPGAGAGGRRQRPNRILLGVLGVAAVAAVGRLAAPGMFGGGTHGAVSFSAPLTDRHLVLHAPTTTVPGSGTATTVARPVRDPFTPPPGYGP